MMKMSTILSLFFILSLAIHNTNAFNITNMLSQFPDYSTFNRYLTQTNLAGEINSRQTVTVLAVENGNLTPLSGKPLQILKNILSVHVILDYYDVQKLQKLTNRSTTLTTLFQTSGSARGQQGFINVTHLSTTTIAFGSATPGSTLGSNLVKSVASQPYNISVLQVSNVTIPEGIDGPRTSPSASPSWAPSPSPHAPTAPPNSSRAPAPSRAPSGAVAPAATPGVHPIPNAPAADAPAAPAADKDNSPSAGTTALDIGLVLVFMVVLSTIDLASRI